MKKSYGFWGIVLVMMFFVLGCGGLFGGTSDSEPEFKAEVSSN